MMNKVDNILNNNAIYTIMDQNSSAIYPEKHVFTKYHCENHRQNLKYDSRKRFSKCRNSAKLSVAREERNKTDYGRKRIIKRHRKDVQCFCIDGQQGNE